MIRYASLPEGSIQRIELLRSQFKDETGLVALYLFGSVAEGNVKPLSDIDLAVLLNGKIPKMDQLDKELSLRAKISDILLTDEFDLVVLNSAPVHFAFKIIKDGKLLFCKDEMILTSFIEKTISYYLDFKYYKEEFNSVFLEGLNKKYHG